MPSRDRRSRVLVVNPGADVYGSDLQMLESVKGLISAAIDVRVLVPTPGRLVEAPPERGCHRRHRPVSRGADDRIFRPRASSSSSKSCRPVREASPRHSV